MNIEHHGSLTLLVFEPSEFGVYAIAASGHDRVQPHTTLEVSTTRGILAALDGPMFDNCASGGYAASQCSVLRYGLVDGKRGVAFPSARPREGMTIFVDNGVAGAGSGWSVPTTAHVGVQLYPPLVRRGANVAQNVGSNAEAAWRAGVVILRSGKMAFAVQRTNMEAFAAALIAVGAVEAGYTDGGGSTLLATQGQVVAGSSENRKVAVQLVVVHRLNGVLKGVVGVFAGATAIATFAMVRKSVRKNLGRG